jgi:hypothetical protein
MFCCPGIDVGAIIENLEELEQPPVIRNGQLAIRLFADTLPTFDFAAPDYIGLGWTVTGHGFQQWAVRIT